MHLLEHGERDLRVRIPTGANEGLIRIDAAVEDAMSPAPRLVGRSLRYALPGTVGSLLIGYGLREFLRATGGGYYCCNHVYYQSMGAILTLLGWTVIVAAAIRFSDRDPPA